MQMKPYLLGQGVYSYTDMDLSSLNLSYLSWKQQDQLIMTVIPSSLSTKVLHLVVDCQTSHGLWTTLEMLLLHLLTHESCNSMASSKT